MRTLIPALSHTISYPDPPFDIMKNGIATGFDIELMRAVCGRLSLEPRPLAYAARISTASSRSWLRDLRRGDIGNDDHTGTCCDRAVLAPIFAVNQGIAVNRRLTPHVSSTATCAA